MTSEAVTFSDPANVEAALLSDLLAPPPRPENLMAGATADLRDAMARFRRAGTHAGPRQRVDQAIETVSNFHFTAHAQRHAGVQIRTGQAREALSDVGFIVPVETMATALGVPASERSQVRQDVATVVNVIGRGEPSSEASDLAASRLVERFHGGDYDAVAAVSLLYQTHDATAALFASVLVANQTHERRRPALSVTVRTPVDTVTIGNQELQTGTTVVVDLEATRLEFGAGRHACPGRSIAERIVAGMLQALREAGLELDSAAMKTRPDGRPASLPLRPTGAAS